MMVCSRGTQTGRNLTFALLGLTLAESTKKVWQRLIPFIRRKLRCYFCQRYSTVSIYLNPLLPSISLHIPYTVPYTFTKGFDKENLFNNRRWLCKEKLDACRVFSIIITNFLVAPLFRHIVSDTACMSTEMSFKELFEHLAMYIYDPEQRWKQVVRAKRCLSNCSDIGGCGYDQCYFEGILKYWSRRQ